MMKSLPNLGISILILVSYCNLDGALLVDPYDTSNTNYLVFSGTEGGADDENRAITSSEILAINGSSLPPPSLPQGLYFFGIEQTGADATWYVSTNGGFFPEELSTYKEPITTNAGLWVFTEDLEIMSEEEAPLHTPDYIVTSQNDDYYAVTWRIHSYSSPEEAQQNFQMIWVRNDVSIAGQIFKAKDIVYAYGDLNGLFDTEHGDAAFGIGVTKEAAGEYVTLSGASTESGSEGFITDYDDIPSIAVFRWDETGSTYNVLTSGLDGSIPNTTGRDSALYQTEFFNTMNWASKVPDKTPVSYKIYRDSTHIQTVDATSTTYEDHNLAQNTSYSYEIYAVDSESAETLIATATIQTEKE